MASPTITDTLLRSYLLGQVSEMEREQVEIQFLTDSAVHEQLDIVEGELIDDFVDGELDDLETRAFLVRLAATPAQRLRIRFAAALKRGLAGRKVSDKAGS
jgi:anti-sigma factor RsiW